MDDTPEGYEILTATEASRSFSELLHRVCYGGQSFIIKKGSRMMARIMPMAPAEAEITPKPVQPVQEKAPQAAPVQAALEPPRKPNKDKPMTAEEAEFYHAWMEQVRKVPVLSE